LPGTLLAGRYRIIALLGKGGMGEVYRADDLTLAQQVALKFLPEAASRDEDALARFRNEVRTARRVSNPNVCRVYDVGEIDGQTFLSMEYIDGEDLASLLRRIGRLPQDKALEIARQLCAGLGAAHHEGVLHRDLKPSNIMLDGRGHAVITDFGLAGMSGQIDAADFRTGTPTYMAPEQLAGKDVTLKSDIYSLGLVLYEIFTGKRAFEAATLAELVRTRSEGPPSSPSSRVKDIDPMVERAIMRCLEPDPASRPSSALALAAALPGGDPLAAALAAGETPSPQMVAAAGELTGLQPRAAVFCLAAVILGMALCFYLGAKQDGLQFLSADKPPEVLAEKSREIVATLGYPPQTIDRAGGFIYDGDYMNYIEEKHQPGVQWNSILAQRPSTLLYWYRLSPRYLEPNNFWNMTLTPGVVLLDDPPSILSGMIDIEVDMEGRLNYFQAIPPQQLDPAPSSAAPKSMDWSSLFTAAGLDVSRLQPAVPEWNSLAASDSRAAWTGVWPGSGLPLRVEAAAFQGQAVYFSLNGPWAVPERMREHPESKLAKAGGILEATIFMGLVLLGAWRAYTHFRSGKGDRRGAARLAIAIFGLEMLLTVVHAHLTPSANVIFIFVLAVSTGLFVSGVLWTTYMALEPYVRRHWPQTIITWSRVIDARWRDPLVGRDLLFGAILGILWAVIFKLGFVERMRTGAINQFPSTAYLMGFAPTISDWLANIVNSIFGTLIFFFALVLLRVLLKNRWLAAAAFVFLFTAPRALGSSHWLIQIAIWGSIYGIAAVSVVRFGFVVLALGSFSANLLLNLPYPLDPGRWYAVDTYLVLVGLLAVAVWGFYTSLGRETVLKTDWLS
jgi:predicted Ser/Thr protein kinase